MKALIPLPLNRQPDSRLLEIPEVTVAGGQSDVVIASVALPFQMALVDVMLAGVDGTTSDVAGYHVQGIVRNMSTKGAFATQVLTFTGNAVDTQTVTIGTKVYTFQTTLTDVDGNVKIGTDAEESIDNLYAAINLGTGAGTAYASSMTLHPTVTASAEDATTLTVKAKVSGTAANSIATTETLANASWGNTTLLGGVDTAALIGSVDAVVAEDDSNWAASFIVDGPSSTVKVRVTSDSANATKFGGFVNMIRLI